MTGTTGEYFKKHLANGQSIQQALRNYAYISFVEKARRKEATGKL
jgi:hypothetical protein